MPLAAPNANAQQAALQRLITKRSADGSINLKDAKDILALAKKENVQNGELGLLRTLATSTDLGPGARAFLRREVDQIVPAGAPTAQLAAILFRLDPNVGRKQLLSLLDHAKNPVAGGPKTFVVTGLGPPYLAAITTAQVMVGLTKFMDGATPAQQKKIRGYLEQQLETLRTPVARGGLAVPGIVRAPKGLAFSDDTRAGGIIAVNQQAVVLCALEKVASLKGHQTGPIAQKAHDLAKRAAAELHADLKFAYPATGPLAYSLTMRGGKAVFVQAEDGNHLKTTLSALKSLTVFGAEFAPAVKRIEARFPEIASASPQDLTGRSGHIYSDEFNAFRDLAYAEMKDHVVTGQELSRLDSFSKRDGLLTSGERALIRRAKTLSTP